MTFRANAADLTCDYDPGTLEARSRRWTRSRDDTYGLKMRVPSTQCCGITMVGATTGS